MIVVLISAAAAFKTGRYPKVFNVFNEIKAKHKHVLLV